MLTLLICGAITGYLFYRFNDNCGSVAVFGTLIGTIIGIFLALLIGMAVDKGVETRGYQLEALADNSMTSGSFFLGSGYIDEQMKYVYYSNTRTDDKGNKFYSMKMVRHEKAEVSYITEGLPYIEERWYVKGDSFWSTFTLVPPRTHWIFYVPKGTINNSYKLDAQ